MELEEAVRMAREAGALVENWMTNPPKPGLFYMKPEQLLALANAIEAKAAAKEREKCRVAARNAVLALPDAHRRSGDLLDLAIEIAIRRRDKKDVCWCETCRPNTLEDQRLIVCGTCGNKRCPRATHHDNECTGSNAPGQKGSSWENVKPAAIRARGATDGQPT